MSKIVSKQKLKRKNLENVKQQKILTFRENWFSKMQSKRDHITFVLSAIDVSIKNRLRNLFLQTVMCHVTNFTKLKVLTNVGMFALLVINIFKKITLLLKL